MTKSKTKTISEADRADYKERTLDSAYTDAEGNRVTVRKRGVRRPGVRRQGVRR